MGQRTQGRLGIDGKDVRTFLVAAHLGASSLTGLIVSDPSFLEPLPTTSTLFFSPSPCCCPPFRADLQLSPSCQDPEVPWEVSGEDRNTIWKDCSWQRTVYEGKRSMRIRSIKVVCKVPVVLICQPDHFPEGIQEGGRCCHPKGEFCFLKDGVCPGSRRDSAKLSPHCWDTEEEPLKGKKERGRPPAVPSCQQLQKVLKTFGDTNHARVYPVTEPPGSKGPDQEPQSVPVLFVTDFKDGWPSQRGVCQDKIYLSVLPRPDADLPFLKRLIKVIEYLPSSPTHALSRVAGFLKGTCACLWSVPEETVAGESTTLCCPSYGYLHW